MKAVILMLGLSLFAAGCATDQVRIAAGEVKSTVAAANDQVLDASHASFCATALSAIKRRFGDRPETLRAMLRVCGWSEHNADIMAGAATERMK